MSFENFKKKDTPLVWAHRGASGYAPEKYGIESFGDGNRAGELTALSWMCSLRRDDILCGHS